VEIDGGDIALGGEVNDAGFFRDKGQFQWHEHLRET
jgi:hypothetical protein